MLDELRGEVLGNFPGEVTLDEVIEWCDGPRLRLVRTQGETQDETHGETHLAIWNDSQEGVERWIYLRVSPERLEEILGGRMPLLEALRDPEDGTLVVQDDNARGHAHTVRTTLDGIDPTSWPLPGAALRKPADPG